MRVRALVSRKLVDENTLIIVVVRWAAAPCSGAASRGGRAVGLGGILERATLRGTTRRVSIDHHGILTARVQNVRDTHHVIPGARARGIRALEARPHVDEHTAVVVQVGRALAVSAATEAGERDCLWDRLVRRGGRLRGREEPPRARDTGEGREGEWEGEDVVCGSVRAGNEGQGESHS